MTPFDWKFLQIGTLRAKDLRKNVSILQKRGLTTVPPTQPIVRLVLLHKQADRTKVFELNCTYTTEMIFRRKTRPRLMILKSRALAT